MNRAAQRATSADHALSLASVSKVYGSAKSAVQALDAVSIGLRRGTFTAVMVPSGSGTSTFLHGAAGPDRPTSGSVRLAEKRTDRGFSARCSPRSASATTSSGGRASCPAVSGNAWWSPAR